MQVKLIDPSLYSYDDLVPATIGSAGLDLKLARDALSALDLYATGVGLTNDLVGTGIAVAIPEGYVGLVVPRSSSGHKHNFRLGNTIGVIDSDYRGEIKLSIGGGDVSKFKRGVTVAQLVVVPYVKPDVQIVHEFSDTTYRGEGGFGSTDEHSNAVPAREAFGPQEWDDPYFEVPDVDIDYCPRHGEDDCSGCKL